jgi:hypothetical protein
MAWIYDPEKCTCKFKWTRVKGTYRNSVFEPPVWDPDKEIDHVEATTDPKCYYHGGTTPRLQDSLT